MFDAFETNVFRCDLKCAKTLHILPFGDTHDCAQAFVEEHIHNMRDFAAKHKPHEIVFIGMGDYGDFASTSERAAIRHGELHETTLEKLDVVAQKDLEKRAKMLSFMKGRLIGLHNGNHDWRFTDGSYASERLAALMGCKHLGYSAYSHVIVAHPVNSKYKSSFVDLFTSHGKGSGKLIGSPFNTVEQMSRIFHDADAYLMGHDHSKGGLPDTRLKAVYNHRTGELEIREKIRYYVRTGSALRGYEAGKKSYISKALYKPCALGFPRIEVTWRRTIVGNEDGNDSLVKELHCWA